MEFVLSFKECEKAVQGVRDTLYQVVGYDTERVEVWISDEVSGSYCCKESDITNIVMGTISQSPELWGHNDTFDAYLFHEFAHAWLFEHTLSKYHLNEFLHVFGDLEDQPSILESWFYDVEYNERKYVSECAAISPEEDFAETFAVFFTEHNGHAYSHIIDKKLKFVGKILTHYSS